MTSFAIAMLLAWIAGYVDATGYLALSQVFTAHMSGNTVAAGLHLGAGEWSEIGARAFSIPMFVFGVFFGAVLGRLVRQKKYRRQFAPSFILEALLLGLFVGLTCRSRIPVPASGLRLYPLIALLAGAMGLQNATLRHVKKMTVRTTFITGMLVNMAERAASYAVRMFDRPGVPRNAPANIQRRRHERKQVARYALLWCGMCIGAVSGGYFVSHRGTAALLLPVAGLVAVILRDFIRPISVVDESPSRGV
jgi:uncharacterized membrane protein YoaK (UPF0700 family)